jgi:site-specific recombinase XerC
VEFVRALAREDLSPLTVRGYARDVELFLDWYAPNNLDKLSAVDLIHYRQHLADQARLRPASLNRRLEVLRRFCRWAHEQKKLKTNVAAEVKLARTLRGVPQGIERARSASTASRCRPVSTWTEQAQLCLDPNHASHWTACERGS